MWPVEVADGNGVALGAEVAGIGGGWRDKAVLEYGG